MAEITFEKTDMDEVAVTIGIFHNGKQIGITNLEDYNEDIPTFTGIELADGTDITMEEVMDAFCVFMKGMRYDVMKMFGNSKEECASLGFEVAEAKSYGWDKAYTAYREL